MVIAEHPQAGQVPPESPVVRQAGLHAFFEQVAAQQAHAVMLGGSVAVTPLNRWVLMGLGLRQRAALRGAVLTLLNAEGRTETVSLSKPADLFPQLRKLLATCRTWPQARVDGLPFGGGLLGLLGYPFAAWCEEALFDALGASSTPAEGFPSLLWCEFEDWLCVDLTDGALHVLSDDVDRETAYRQAWSHAQAGVLSHQELSLGQVASLENLLAGFETSLSPDAFAQAVERLQSHIRAGDLYQANLSMRLSRRLQVDPHAVYARLCAENPSPFSGFFKCPEGFVVSNSPERLVELTAAGQAQTRPIAGTRGRGRDAAEDLAIGQKLLADEKERAEHLMLVDLERNDLGRVCVPGSVQVDELLVLERYSHVTHLVSNVVGQLQPGVDALDLLQAVFPGGTITGCPKIRCMQLLAKNEPVSRGLYTGSMGYLDATTGAMDFNILIRSLFLTPLKAAAPPLVYNAAIHVGAGIVADSVGAYEYRECLRKATALLTALASSAQQDTTEDKGPTS